MADRGDEVVVDLVTSSLGTAEDGSGEPAVASASPAGRGGSLPRPLEVEANVDDAAAAAEGASRDTLTPPGAAGEPAAAQDYSARALDHAVLGQLSRQLAEARRVVADLGQRLTSAEAGLAQRTHELADSRAEAAAASAGESEVRQLLSAATASTARLRRELAEESARTQLLVPLASKLKAARTERAQLLEAMVHLRARLAAAAPQPPCQAVAGPSDPAEVFWAERKALRAQLASAQARYIELAAKYQHLQSQLARARARQVQPAGHAALAAPGRALALANALSFLSECVRNPRGAQHDSDAHARRQWEEVLAALGAAADGTADGGPALAACAPLLAPRGQACLRPGALEPANAPQTALVLAAALLERVLRDSASVPAPADRAGPPATARAARAWRGDSDPAGGRYVALASSPLTWAAAEPAHALVPRAWLHRLAHSLSRARERLLEASSTADAEDDDGPGSTATWAQLVREAALIVHGLAPHRQVLLQQQVP